MKMSNSYLFDNSETSTTEDFLDEEERNVRIFAVQMLKNRIFLGQFQERRRVEQLQTYRDVIVVSESEHDLKHDITVVRKRLRTIYGEDRWIGLTTPEIFGAPNGHCFWIESDDNAFGSYWFKIRGVRFHRKEIIVRVKILRAMTNCDSNESNPQLYMTNFLDNFSWETTFESIKQKSLEYIVWFFTDILTVDNVKKSITFLAVLFAALATFSIKGMGFLMEYSLKLMREISFFIRSSTPVMLAVVNLIGKIIGGFYLLIAMLWRDRNTSQVYITPKAVPAIQYPQYNGGSATITELE